MRPYHFGCGLAAVGNAYAGPKRRCRAAVAERDIVGFLNEAIGWLAAWDCFLSRIGLARLCSQIPIALEGFEWTGAPVCNRLWGCL